MTTHNVQFFAKLKTGVNITCFINKKSWCGYGNYHDLPNINSVR